MIVDRIVNVDAPVANLAEQASVQMLDARRAERSYFLLRDSHSNSHSDKAHPNIIANRTARPPGYHDISPRLQFNIQICGPPRRSTLMVNHIIDCLGSPNTGSLSLVLHSLWASLGGIRHTDLLPIGINCLDLSMLQCHDRRLLCGPGRLRDVRR